MKLINYKYGDLFNCIIHGKIIVSKKEWQGILQYLTRVKADISYPFYKKMVKEDAQRIIKIKAGDLVNIRVWATEKVVSHFNLKNYKRGNYIFLIKN